MYGHLKCSVYSIWDPLTRLYPTWYQLLVKKKNGKKEEEEEKEEKGNVKTQNTWNLERSLPQKTKTKKQRSKVVFWLVGLLYVFKGKACQGPWKWQGTFMTDWNLVASDLREGTVLFFKEKIHSYIMSLFLFWFLI